MHLVLHLYVQFQFVLVGDSAWLIRWILKDEAISAILKLDRLASKVFILDVGQYHRQILILDVFPDVEQEIG